MNESRNKRKTELLAPCGDINCVRAAINAGADSIYMGGKLFGARAFAKSVDENIVDAINICHRYNKKFYLTVNNLIKNSEFKVVDEYLDEIVKVKPDAFIVADIGLAQYLKNRYDIPLHASTQMNITSIDAIKYLEHQGFKNVILARELTLDEIKKIRKAVDIDIECFIHGSMCYCYSGNCLMSSFMGGNSGNRGRCKGPCRLEYKYKNKNAYLLSMKDMCSIREIKNLIDIGINTLKIEGRMRSEIYVAGVVSIYREIIDKIYDNIAITEKEYSEYENRLLDIYDKGGFTNYYSNQTDMIQMVERNKRFHDAAIIDDIKNKYLDNNKRIKLDIDLYIKLGDKLKADVYNYEKDRKQIFIYDKSSITEAKNNPLTKEVVIEKFSKTGNTDYELNHINVYMDDNVFLPVSELNNFRREILDYDFS